MPIQSATSFKEMQTLRVRRREEEQGCCTNFLMCSINDSACKYALGYPSQRTPPALRTGHNILHIATIKILFIVIVFSSVTHSHFTQDDDNNNVHVCHTHSFTNGRSPLSHLFSLPESDVYFLLEPI